MAKRRRQGSKGRRSSRQKLGIERRETDDRRAGAERRLLDEPLPTPLEAIGPAGDVDPIPRPPLSFATRLHQLAHIDVEEPRAEALWRNVARHRRELFRRLGRDVGQRVALLDYVLNVDPQVVEPTIIETNTLEALKRDAISDGVTGLFNRHYFDGALRREAERCHRYGVTASLLLLDLDDFKEINDQYGHRVGDKALQMIGHLILKHVRAADVPCRYGGDEFAVILSDTPQGEAFTVAERIRADVEQSFERLPICGQFLEMSVSGGLATLPLDASSPEQLFILADGALYEAKNAGANRIAIPPASPSRPRPSAA